MRRKKSQLLSNILLSVFTLLFICLLSELAIRWLGLEGEGQRSRIIFEQGLGRLPKTGWHRAAQAQQSQPSLMIRDKEVYWKKPKHINKRILFIGDSGTWGNGVELIEAFPYVFYKLQPLKIQEKIEVINAGIIGMTTVSEYNFFKRYLLKAEPDIVVLGLFMANDINFNLRHDQELSEQSTLETVLSRVTSVSALLNFVYLRAKALLYKYSPNIAKKYTGNRQKIRFLKINERGLALINYAEGEIATYEKKPSIITDYAFEITEEIIARFVDLSEIFNFQFVIALIPTSSTILNKMEMYFYPEALDQLKKKGIHILESDLDFQKPTRRILSICKRHNIICINPTPGLKKLGRFVILLGDDHLSVSGHNYVAKVLSGQFNKSKLVFMD